MAIKVKCGSCDAGFKAKDELAGRRVKCPKCKEPLTIPSAASAPARPAARPAPAARAASHNPLMDLLDEQNIGTQRTGGAMCENCAADLEPGAFVCMECGFNHQTGKRLQTESEEEISSGTVGMTDADRIMAKAEKDIEDAPVAADDLDFGDGAGSYLIAGIALAIGLVLIAAGIMVILSMDYIGTLINTGGISFIASCALYLAMAAWITTVAFKQKPGHGIACLCTGFLWCIGYGFMQGKTLLLPTIILIFAFLIGAASGAYVSYNGFAPTEGSRQIQWQEEAGPRLQVAAIDWDAETA